MIHGSSRNERGFTFAEVMITIAIMGVLAAIAIPSWWSVIEGRRVDSATNQLAGDLRIAHDSATNRLTAWRVELTDNSSTYTVGEEGEPPEARDFCSFDNDADCNFDPIIQTPGNSAVTIAFCNDGSAEMPAGSPPCPAGRTSTPNGSVAITIQSSDGNPSRTIQFNTANARINVD